MLTLLKPPKRVKIKILNSKKSFCLLYFLSRTDIELKQMLQLSE